MTKIVKFEPTQTFVVPGSERFPFELRVLTQGSDKDYIYALRNRAYQPFLGGDYKPDGLYTDAHDGLMTTAHISAHDGGKCVGALRVCFSHPGGGLESLPCAAYYPDLVCIKRVASGSLVEISRMSIEPDITNTSYKTTLYGCLVRAGLIAAQAADASNILVATKVDWVRFYQFLLGFKIVGPPALYPPGNIPITLLAGSMADAKVRQHARNAFFRTTPEEIESMRVALGPALCPANEEPRHGDVTYETSHSLGRCP